MKYPRLAKHSCNRSDMMMKSKYLIILVAYLMGMLPTPASAQVGSCTTGRADAILSTNNVRARILNNGNLFFGGAPNVYTVPKADGIDPIFSAGLLMGGYVGSTLRVAGSTYGPYEYWPGPVSAVVAGGDCAEYDRIYRVARRDFNALDEGEAPSADMLEWPWELGAPVVDGDGNQNNYDLAAGDRPEIFGDESFFWIMNDVGNVHTKTGSAPLGVEVHVTAFSAASTNSDIDNATFYRYRIFNRNSLPIEDAYLGLWSDTDLGNWADDYVGSAPTLNLAYAYNADNDDEGANGYGAVPPAIGYQILGGPTADSDGLDNDNDGSIDEQGEQIGLSSFLVNSPGGGVQGDPRTGQDMYNNMQGLWKDSTPVTKGGTGYLSGGLVTQHMFSGTPPGFWSEFDADSLGTPNTPVDRRFVAGIGPFSLQPGESMELFIGTLWARGTDNLDSVSKLFGVAARLYGSTPNSIAGNLSVAVVETPELTVPGDMAAGQPLDVTLEWIVNSIPGVQFEVQLADNDGFLDATSIYSEVTTVNLNGYLESDVEYVWRVRAFSSVEYGPWSGGFSFSTGAVTFLDQNVFDDLIVVANSSGVVSPPSGAGADFQGFPGTGQPDNRQQSNGSTWFVHTGGNGSRGSYNSFAQRVTRNGVNDPTPYDYEIRFTGTSLHYDRFQSATVVVADPLPFELWNIGIGTPTDTGDDFRLIAVGIDWELDGWGLRDFDHEVSASTNDPETDWFYIFEPVDTTPGTSGYDTWALGALTDPAVNLGREVIARLVFVNWNGGNVLDEPPVYNAVMPEPGTIFRLETSLLPAPILASPGNDEYTTPGDVSFFWSSASMGNDRLIIADDKALTSIVSDLSNVAAGVAVNLAAGTYFWQIQGFAGESSEVWSFNVASTIQFDFVVESGWNLLGIPFSALDMSTAAIFGASVANSVTAFTGQYARPHLNQVHHGNGYWAEFLGPGLVSNDVFVRSIIDFELDPGWNLLAGPDCTLDASLVTGDTGVIAPGTLFGYALGAYFLSTEYVGGRGYWLFADAAGQITLDCAMAKGGKNLTSDLDLLADFGSFRLTPNDQGTRTLYFAGKLPDNISNNAFSLPPLAPAQTWQAQFSDGRYVTESETAVIDLNGAPLPIFLERGNIEPDDGMKIVLRDASGVLLEEFILESGESYEINHAGADIVEISVLPGISTGTESTELPEIFEIEQNYPNPFNPVTTIRFALPEADEVTVMIMDLTGRVVATPVRNTTFSAGWHDISFDAHDLASGVYFYRVATRAESRTMKMVLLR